MNRALWLLLWLDFRGWLRASWRSLHTVKGILLALVGLLFLSLWSLWILSSLLSLEWAGADPDGLRRYAPAVLLCYSLLSVLFSKGELALHFSPAEVNLLFPGPFTRRQLLGCHLTGAILILLPTTLFFTLFLYPYARWFLAAFFGLFLTLLFMQLFQMVLNLLAAALGAQLYTRGRKLLLLLVLLLIASILFEVARTAEPGHRLGVFGRIEQTWLWQTLTSPLRWFVEVFVTEPGAWGHLLLYVALAGVVLSFLLVILLLLDAHYLEAAAATSEKIFARLQRIRRDEGGGGWSEASGKFRLGLPDFPWWGGIGPIAWRQSTLAVRSLGRLALGTLLIGALLMELLIDTETESIRTERGWPYNMLALLFWLTVVMKNMMTYDFRSDLERIEVLKTLPLPPWRLALGQLVTPVLLLSLLQVLVLGAILLTWGRWDSLLVYFLAFAGPLNLLVFGLSRSAKLFSQDRLQPETL